MSVYYLCLGADQLSIAGVLGPDEHDDNVTDSTCTYPSTARIPKPFQPTTTCRCFSHLRAAQRDALCDADTNAAAIAAIEFAIESAEVLDLSVDPLWQHTASRLHIPFDARHNIHPEFVGELLW